MRRKITLHFFGSWCTIVNNWNDNRLNLTSDQGKELLDLFVKSGITRIIDGRVDVMCAAGLPPKLPPVTVLEPGVAICADNRFVQDAVDTMCRIPVVTSDSPNWPEGGAAISKRDGLLCALLRPGMDDVERRDAINWVNSELDVLRAEANEAEPVHDVHPPITEPIKVNLDRRPSSVPPPVAS